MKSPVPQTIKAVATATARICCLVSSLIRFTAGKEGSYAGILAHDLWPLLVLPDLSVDIR